VTAPLGWRSRWANLRAALVTLVTGRHVYLSTSCLHGEHAHCRSTLSAHGGIKLPGRCKFGPEVCRCPTCRHGIDR
jgi:hypothetical protein